MSRKRFLVPTRCLIFGLGAVGLLSMRTQAALLAEPAHHGQSPAMTSGCSVNGPKTGLFTQTTVDGNHVARTYLLQVPDSYSASRAYPLVFVFHGRSGTAAQSHSWGLQNAKGAAENAIFVFPQGIVFRNFGVGWDDSNRGYDMTFFDNMLRDLKASYCVDSAQVFVAGFSWGGDFVTALACSRGDTIRAMAANSATDDFRNKSDYRTYEGLPCKSHSLPAIRFEHAAESDSAYPAPEFATTSKLYRSFDRCSNESKAVPSSANTESCAAYSGCAKELVECSFDKSIGHKLPPNWAQDTWDFFQGFLHP